jgi:hypothetical protein
MDSMNQTAQGHSFQVAYGYNGEINGQDRLAAQGVQAISQLPQGAQAGGFAQQTYQDYERQLAQGRQELQKLAHTAMDPMHNHCVEAPKTKAPNPKQLYGDKKPPVHLIHQIAELHESAALHAGKRKYGENNYLKTEVEAMTYVGAILRHVKAWASGERVDPKELVHHLGAVKACCTILMTSEATGMLIDNRPQALNGNDRIACNRAPATYQQATRETLAEVERTIEHLNKLYPELL